MKKTVVLAVLIVAGLVGVLWLATPIWAFDTGIVGHSGNPATNFGMSCNACHGGGVQPIVSLSGPTTLGPGESAIYALTIQSQAVASQTAAGFNVSATDGVISSLGGDTQIIDGEITHVSPKANNGAGVAVFSFQWTAPASAPQAVILYAAGNSVNLDDTPGGDRHANTTLTVNVVNPTAVQLTGVAAAASSPATLPVAAAALLALVLGAIVGWRFQARPRP